MKRADILEKAGHPSLYWAAHRGDMAAVRALMEAGADVEEIDETFSRTATMVAAQEGRMEILLYLAEECGANLRHVDSEGAVALHLAAHKGHLDMVRYLSEKAPDLIDLQSNRNISPLMDACTAGKVHVVRYLLRLGCSLSQENCDGYNALDISRVGGHHDTARLLFNIESAGGWRLYAVACRMAYVRIRHEVSKTYAVLEEGHDDRALLHFVFGRNRTVVGAAAPTSHGERLEEASEDGGAEKRETRGNEEAGTASESSEAIRAMSVKQLKAAAKERGVSLVGCLEKADIITAVLAADVAGPSHAEEEASGNGSEKPKAMLELPDFVFRLVCRFLEGWPAEAEPRLAVNEGLPVVGAVGEAWFVLGGESGFERSGL